MEFYSTNNKNLSADLKEVVLKGLASDGGLFMPKTIPHMPESFFENLHNLTFTEIAFEVSKKLLGDDVPEDVLKTIIDDAFDFPVPLVEIKLGVSVLELYHGPTMSFKDFGARFMSRLMSYFLKGSEKELTILVATSGDTGSAVASGFLNVPGINVIILYPSGKVSPLQEKQLTTMGGNIKAVEVNGVFDDCQKMVKAAFVDEEIIKKFSLASANSISIARLLPQTFYYFYAYAKIVKSLDKTRDSSGELKKPVVISVPSGNYGNITAGLIAKRMGLPIKKFIASTNANNVVPEFLEKGIFKARDSVQTISNAMDVGNPSNFARMLELYGHSAQKMSEDIIGFSFSDDETKHAIKEVYEKYNYLMDPHGAVAYLGLEKYMKDNDREANGIFLETAHPAKFGEVVEEVLGKKIDIPDQLKKYLDREKESTVISSSFSDFKEFLLK